MSEGLRKKIVFATLPLAILWAAFNFSTREPMAPIESSSAPSLETIAPITAPTQSDARFINIKEKQAEPWGEDPFRTFPGRLAAAPKAGSQLAWTLGGIIHGDRSSVAFVNEQMVRVGDRVDEATVVSINRKSVVLDIRGRRITLKLNKG